MFTKYAQHSGYTSFPEITDNRKFSIIQIVVRICEHALERYRDNYGRLLVFVHVDGMDYQEHMIAEDYSPYFTKYGNARFHIYHHRYLAAERAAQAARRGVWNQVAVNGAEQRNYAVLTAWWALRAAVIEDYRRARSEGADILDSRLRGDSAEGSGPRIRNHMISVS